MRWKKLFTPVESIDSGQAKSFMDEHPEGSYTLLDVRQPAEYEQSHLPGARLIPVAQLPDRLGEINPDQPVVVYCAIGGRSRAASQLLAGKGFDEVYNLQGGIKAWEGKTAATPIDLGELSLTGNETESEIIILIYGLESGLEKFYRQAALSVSEEPVKDLLKKLADIEARHKARLSGLFAEMNPGSPENNRLESAAVSGKMEGGFDVEAFLAGNRLIMASVEGVLDLAMMLETHGLDLYLRYAQDISAPEGKKLLMDLAEEEKAHLRALGKMLEENLPV